MKLSAGKLWSMRRMSDSEGFFKMTAVDQRPPIQGPIAKYYNTKEAPYEDVSRFKELLVRTLQDQSTAMLLDPIYAIPRSLDKFSPTKGLIVTLEEATFEETPGGRKSSSISDWSVNKIKRLGGDAVKLLTWYRPDASAEVIRHQQEFTRQVGEACKLYDIPFLLELLLYPLPQDTHQTKDYVEQKGKNSDHVLQSVAEFADPKYGVDVFKLESPLNAEDVPGVGNPGWEKAQELFDEMGRLAGRPWVMLSAGADKKAFQNIMTHAYKAGASGYLAGRAIWLEAFGFFPEWEKIEENLSGSSVRYMKELNELTDTQATPWHKHEVYGGKGLQFPYPDSDFRAKYGGM